MGREDKDLKDIKRLGNHRDSVYLNSPRFSAIEVFPCPSQAQKGSRRTLQLHSGRDLLGDSTHVSRHFHGGRVS
jgi:hypothetical protein